MMKTSLFLLPLFLFCFLSPAHAVDSQLSFPLEHAMQSGKVLSALHKDIALYWGARKTPAIVQNFGHFKTSKRTNGLGKSKQDACDWALASAIVTLQKRAVREGGNAVINLKSNLNNNPVSSTTTYECLAGSLIINVALTGDVVKLAR